MKLLTIAIRRVLSYFEIVTLQPKLPILHKEKTPARMTLPTLLITDPKFVYQSAACTDISQTFEKAKEEFERVCGFTPYINFGSFKSSRWQDRKKQR